MKLQKLPPEFLTDGEHVMAVWSTVGPSGRPIYMVEFMGAIPRKALAQINEILKEYYGTQNVVVVSCPDCDDSVVRAKLSEYLYKRGLDA